MATFYHEDPRLLSEMAEQIAKAEEERMLAELVASTVQEDILVFFYTNERGQDCVDYGIGAETQKRYVLPPDAPYKMSEKHDWWVLA